MGSLVRKILSFQTFMRLKIASDTSNKYGWALPWTISCLRPCEHLYILPHQLKPGVHQPGINQLRRKFIVKAKKTNCEWTTAAVAGGVCVPWCFVEFVVIVGFGGVCVAWWTWLMWWFVEYVCCGGWWSWCDLGTLFAWWFVVESVYRGG